MHIPRCHAAAAGRGAVLSCISLQGCWHMAPCPLVDMRNISGPAKSIGGCIGMFLFKSVEKIANLKKRKEKIKIRARCWIFIPLLIRHDSTENRGYVTSVEPKANTPFWQMIHYDTKLRCGLQTQIHPPVWIKTFCMENQNGRKKFPTCSGLTPGGTHAYSSSAHPESSSEVELLWKPSDNFPIFPPARDSISKPRGVGRSRFIAHELCGEWREEDFRVTLTES